MLLDEIEHKPLDTCDPQMMGVSATYPMVLGIHVSFFIKHGTTQLFNEFSCLHSVELSLSSFLICLLLSAVLRIQFNLAHHITIWMCSLVNCFICFEIFN